VAGLDRDHRLLAQPPPALFLIDPLVHPGPSAIRHVATLSVNRPRRRIIERVSTARRHHRLLSVSAFALLLVTAEVAGRWLTVQVDGLLHVGDPMAASARYTP